VHASFSSTATRARTRTCSTKGSLTFVVIGGGATGVEAAGALGELAHDVMPHVHENPALAHGHVVLVDLGHAVLAPFSDEAHEYAAKQLGRRGVELKLGVSAKEIGSDHVTLSDGSNHPHASHGLGAAGLQAAPIGASSGLPQGRGGRIDVQPDLSVEGHPNVFVLGDFANVPSGDDPSCRSSGASRSSPATGRRRTSWPTSRARAAGHSSTRTRGSWR
jgi:NADH dehydrogenase